MLIRTLFHRLLQLLWRASSASRKARWPASLGWRFLALAIASSVLTATPAGAQPTATEAALNDIRQQIDRAQKALDTDLPDAELLGLRQTTLDLQAKAAGIADDLGPQLASLQARLAELGPVPAGATEDADIARQRTQLEFARSALDGQVKLARLLAVEGEQLAGRTLTLRRSLFQARLGERTNSILAPRFWSELRADAPRDIARLATLGGQVGTAVRAAPWWAWAGAALGIAALWSLRPLVERRATQLIAARVPPSRLRRSLFAFTVVLGWTLALGCSFELLHAALDWRGTLPPPIAQLSDRIQGMAWFAGYLAGLLHALISAGRPSWRLGPLPDAVAERLRRLPVLLTVVSIVVRSAELLTAYIEASLAVTVAVDGVVALALAATIGSALVRAERVWQRALRRDGATQRPIWLAVIAGASWLVLLGGFVSVLVGYVAFGSFAVKQVLWTATVCGSAYLLTALIDDALMTWLAAPGAAEPATDGSGPLHPAAGLPFASARTRDQAAVLLSGILRLFVLLMAAVLVLAPFGEGPADLWRRGTQWPAGLAIGEVKIRPDAVLQAVLVLGFGLLAVRVLRGWLADRYLPTTRLDPGMRVSATTLFGYAGVVLAVSLALSAVGIGLERVAWVASALSVGIGFGLQAVVQNFVSGLILLAERPVKVGDWVSLGGVEGDIRRINVRATEIQMGDRSTVIVPNSEFITKVVRNVTLSDPLGLVQVKLPVPLGSDVDRVRDLMLAAFRAHADVLDTPEPNVLLDGIEHGLLMFNASGFVASPRLVGGVRSALLFDVLRRFGEAGVALASPPTMVLAAPAAAPTGLPPLSAAAPMPAEPVASASVPAAPPPR